MTISHPGKFPPVKPKPTVDDCIKAARISDYFQWAGVTAASWGYGFLVGRPARFAMAGLMGGIGFTFGSLVMLQNTRGRLMGFRENSVEVAKYGEDKSAPRGDEMIKPKLDYKRFN